MSRKVQNIAKIKNHANGPPAPAAP